MSFNVVYKSMSRGFTLVEILVALAIFSLCAAVLTAQSTSTLHNRQRLIEQQTALWIAKNRLAEIRNDVTSTIETEQSEQQQLGRAWDIQTTVELTAHPQLKKVIVRVAPQSDSFRVEGGSAQLVAYITDQL